MPNPQVQTLTVDGTTYDIVDNTSGYSSVSIDRKVSTGTNIADITIDGTKTELYAPQGGGGSVESVAVANDTNGGLSVSGSPITSSGTITIGHSNVLSSAQTTQAVYPIKIDKNGHISEYGSAVTIPVVPSATDSATTGITISDHTTGSITGVQSSTTSVTGVQSSTTSVRGVKTGSNSTTTASKVTLGTAISVPNVTAVGSGSFTQGAFDGGSFTQGEDSFTPNIPTAIDTTKFSGGSFTSGAFSGGSFTSGTFTAGSLTMAMDSTDTKQLNITFTAPSHGSDSFTPATHAADSFTGASLASGFYSAGSAASFTQGVDSFTPATHGTDTHVHTAPTLGTAISVPNVTGATDVTVPIRADADTTVPIKDSSATTVPIKNTSSTTVVTGKTHTITDNGHTHDLG